MAETFTYTFDTPVYKGSATIHTELFVNGEWVKPVDKAATIDVVNPATGKVITAVSIGSAADVDIAVAAALKAYQTSWGLKCPGTTRARLLNKLADLVEKHLDELAALEALDVGKSFYAARGGDITLVVSALRYFAGWADKIQGKTIETHEGKFAYTRREPYGVVGQIIPWNFPLVTGIAKIAPALATGNTIVLKPSELTPLTALRFADLINEAGFPPGVFNVVNGYGPTVGAAIAAHPEIRKIAFTGSTLVGRSIMRAAAESNLKSVTLELGGKSPTIIFDDADLEQAVKWASMGVFYNAGQACIAGSRIFVHEGIYDQFLEKMTQVAQGLTNATGGPFEPGTQHGPLVSQTQFDRVMGYIESGKSEGAKVHIGGVRLGNEGFFVQPTIFTDVKPEMRIIREEIFGPVAAVIKFKMEEEVIEAANNTTYGLSCMVMSQNISRALRVAHALEAGSAWINSAQEGHPAVPFGGYKQSGIGRELGEYALEAYTQVKAVHVNLGLQL
ncbi:putative aldehyde dehydrogenase family protein [Lyophyllum shimeji]|uniref:Aldehyde dehydrogenase n=1 Tax=Lyophyllum shimeji TaxID=47721 RepID=A0A9P3PPP7_LYOSH|nr:putative aldehyde dehydrogenase family protein [Lyophyllum shimeji]